MLSVHTTPYFELRCWGEKDKQPNTVQLFGRDKFSWIQSNICFGLSDVEYAICRIGNKLVRNEEISDEIRSAAFTELGILSNMCKEWFNRSLRSGLFCH